MSTFTNESDNTTALEQPSNSHTDTSSILDEDDTLQIKMPCDSPCSEHASPCSEQPSPNDKDGQFAYPRPEEIAECSPGATFTTYKMGGSTGVAGKENQDACSVISIKRQGVKYAVTTVCDGHGLNGQGYANHVVALLPQLVIQNFARVLAEPVPVLKELFAQVSTKLENLMGFKSGGTTATVTILSDGQLICANLSDCEALIKISEPTESIVVQRNGQVIPTEISNGVIRATVSHNSSNMEEVERVLKAGAAIRYASQMGFAKQLDVFIPVVDADGKTKYERTPHAKQQGGFVSNLSNEPAIYFHGGGTVNMTRSFGDWNIYFLSSEPDVTVITWTPGTKTRLVVASDGYFNCFSKADQELELSFDLSPAEICQRGHTAVGKTFGYKYGDNTTIVVLKTGV
jgi:serine/threonine protein phosphatase PrpC